MKICLVHNHYQLRGGEDSVFEAERELLESRGERVVSYTLHNDSIREMQAVELALTTLWSRQSARELQAVLRRERPEVVHFHNTFPLISPAAYYTARSAGARVVQTLHNFRLICPNGLLYRDGHACEDCVGRTIPWPGVVHACYRGSTSASAMSAAMLVFHRAMGTWRNLVDVYLACTEFARRKFIQGGIPESRIVVKPNCLISDPGAGVHDGDYALFVGRLVPEKGVPALLEAWALLGGKVPLRVVGNGPLANLLERPLCGVQYLGWQPHADVIRAMQGAAFLVFPSEWYEGFPLTVLEAMAVGLPVVTSGVGGVGEVVQHGRTGLLYQGGNAAELATVVQWAYTNRKQMAEMGQAARQEFLARFSADRNYEMLIAAYRRALTNRHNEAPAEPAPI